MMTTRNLFISHSRSYSGQYDRLMSLLTNRSDFDFMNHSVSNDDLIHDAGTDNDLKIAIMAKMMFCEIVFRLFEVYAFCSQWIDIEIDLAQTGFALPKPIIAIEPWGSERFSGRVKDAADHFIRRQTHSVIDAIREEAN